MAEKCKSEVEKLFKIFMITYSKVSKTASQPRGPQSVYLHSTPYRSRKAASYRKPEDGVTFGLASQ